MPKLPARSIGGAVLVLFAVQAPSAHACVPPVRPFLPDTSQEIRNYADLIRADFEAYIIDVQYYLRCLDAERIRVFAEAQAVTADYVRFAHTVE